MIGYLGMKQLTAVVIKENANDVEKKCSLLTMENGWMSLEYFENPRK